MADLFNIYLIVSNSFALYAILRLTLFIFHLCILLNTKRQFWSMTYRKSGGKPIGVSEIDRDLTST